jgi:retron-type reverse transcriptase
MPFSPPGNCSYELKITFCVRGVASPLLANLFLHYAFDRWMAERYPRVPFERYADDGAPRAQRAEEGPMCVTA